MNMQSYYLSKINNDYLSLTKKIDFSCKLTRNIMNNKLKYYLQTNDQMEEDEYDEIYFLICKVKEDIMDTIQQETLAINNYFSAGLVDKNDYDFSDAHTAYTEKRKEYLDFYNKATKMLQSIIHDKRYLISTPKMEDSCAICSKKHNKQCALILSCNHAFGIKCFHKWADTCIDQQKVVTCPLCRETNV